jgi:hypothetical protein
MRCLAVVPVLSLLLPLSWPSPPANAGEIKPSSRPTAGIQVWDTTQPAAPLLTPAALAGKNDWTAVPSGAALEGFKGTAVLSNGRIGVTVRHGAGSVEVHAVKPDGVVSRLSLRLETTAGEPAQRLDRLGLVENTKGSASLEASFRTAKGEVIAAKFRVKRGDVTVQVDPGAGAGKLRVECPARFVILPDFFADDITLDASRLPLGAVDLPSENFVLHLTGQGAAIAMCVFENRKQDVKVALAGDGAQRVAKASEIAFEGKKIWVGLLEAPQIWHARDVQPADTGKVVPLDWQMPFAAQWRVDFSRSNDLTDSWEMLLQDRPGGGYVKPSWLGSGDENLPSSRLRWNTVLGRYPYPCWSDPARHGFLQPLRSRVLQFQGPAIIYPIHRVKQTPLDAFTVVDVMRNTLGVGPCEHLLDLEGQKSEYRGRATCGVRDTLTPIYASKQQKQQRAKIDRTLDEGLIFVKHIRGRITRYVEFGQKMRQYLAEQKKAHPELADFIAEMDKLTQEIDARVAKRAQKIKTPADVALMNDAFRKNVLDYDGPDALERCRQYTRALVEVGDNQDELSGECRWVVKALRQRAGILLAQDPRVAPIASEIRTRTQEVLRNPASHEGARH